MNPSETAAHRELKRRALIWAQAHGYRVAAAEVSLPNLRFRLDVAAYRPERIRQLQPGGGMRQRQIVGLTAVFECKASKPDFLRDARSVEELRLYYPSIANGDSLFQEYHSIDFERPGHERYQRTLRDIQRLQGRLHANTKFDRLVRWGAANLFWVVADPDIIAGHELPAGWGLLVHQGGSLEVAVKPLLHEVSESDRLALFHRIALAGSRAVNREHTSAAGSDMAYIVNSAAIEQTFQNGLNADSANWQALMEANANPDTRGDADSALGFNNGRGPAVSPEEAASGLAWVQQTEKALATTLMEPEPQFQQWWNQELAEAASMPAGNAALQALTSVRSRAQALIVEDAMFEAGMALEQNNQTQFQSIINPSTGRPFTYTQTANGLQVASSLTLGGKPMTLSFPAPAR